MRESIRVLMVCLGNICRSPLAEVVMRERAENRDLAGYFHFASAGTGSWHIGSGADPRSAQTARENGLDLSRHRAQQVHTGNVGEWDWLVAMDRSNHADLLAMGVRPERLLMMRQFEAGNNIAADVPDPYYGGHNGFAKAYLMLQQNADLILDHLVEAERIEAR